MSLSDSRPAGSRGGGRIRRFGEKDVPLVASLHRTVWGSGSSALDLGPYYEYFSRVFLENPSRNTELPSLVYEEHDGRIIGFLGIVPRRMVMNGRQVLAAVSSQFIVDPTSCVPV